MKKYFLPLIYFLAIISGCGRTDEVNLLADRAFALAKTQYTDIKPQYRGEVHATTHCALIGRNDHQIFLIQRNIGHVLHQRLDHLVGRLYVIKAIERDRVLNSRIVCVKRNNIGNTHINKLLKHKRAVKRFSSASLVLSALVEHGHDY